MFHIVICDDEEVFINYFKELILESGMNEDEVLFYTYASGEEFIKNISWVTADRTVVPGKISKVIIGILFGRTNPYI